MAGGSSHIITPAELDTLQKNLRELEDESPKRRRKGRHKDKKDYKAKLRAARVSQEKKVVPSVDQISSESEGLNKSTLEPRHHQPTETSQQRDCMPPPLSQQSVPVDVEQVSPGLLGWPIISQEQAIAQQLLDQQPFEQPSEYNTAQQPSGSDFFLYPPESLPLSHAALGTGTRYAGDVFRGLIL